MFRKFLWQNLPFFEGETGGGATPPAEPPTPPAPAEAPAAPAPNGSLIPEGEAAAAEPSPGEAPPEPAAEPLKVEDLSLPEGLKADDPALSKFTEILGDSKLSPKDRANALLAAYGEQAKGIAAATAKEVEANYVNLNTQWVNEVKADPVIGGDKLPQVVGVVAKALDAYGDGKAVREVLALTGAGNNPHVIKLLYNMASKLAEGSPAQGSPPKPSRPATEVFYGQQPSQS